MERLEERIVTRGGNGATSVRPEGRRGVRVRWSRGRRPGNVNDKGDNPCEMECRRTVRRERTKSRDEFLVEESLQVRPVVGVGLGVGAVGWAE